MIGTVRSRISHFMNEFGTLGYMKCEGKAGNPKIPIECCIARQVRDRWSAPSDRGKA
jgi:hypothetical protein